MLAIQVTERDDKNQLRKLLSILVHTKNMSQVLKMHKISIGSNENMKRHLM